MKLTKPRIHPLEKNECSPEQLKLLKSLGPASNMKAFKTLVRHPRLFQRLVSSLMYLINESTISARDKELLILRTAWTCGAEYEWSHHSIQAKQAGLSDQEIQRVKKGPNAKEWTPTDSALLLAADALHKDTCIGNSTWALLAEKYGQQQLMDIVFTVALYHMASMLLNSLGVELDQNAIGWPKQKHSYYQASSENPG